MNEEIGLLDLIYQIKDELLSRRPAEEAKGLSELFWIDQIELELSVAATRERGGAIKLSVLPVGAELGGARTEERGHTVKIRLTPLLPLEEMRRMLAQDPEVQKALAELSHILTRESNT